MLSDREIWRWTKLPSASFVRRVRLRVNCMLSRPKVCATCVTTVSSMEGGPMYATSAKTMELGVISFLFGRYHLLRNLDRRPDSLLTWRLHMYAAWYGNYTQDEKARLRIVCCSARPRKILIYKDSAWNEGMAVIVMILLPRPCITAWNLNIYKYNDFSSLSWATDLEAETEADCIIIQ